MPDQIALDSALMFAREKFREEHELSHRRIILDQESREKHDEGYAALAPLNNSVARIMRDLNRELALWYEMLTRDPSDPSWKPKQGDSPPRIEWGQSPGYTGCGFRAAYQWQADATDVVLVANVYSHRWRLTITREISTAKWDEIVAFLRTLAEMGKAAVKAAHDTCAPSWMDKP